MKNINLHDYFKEGDVVYGYVNVQDVKSLYSIRDKKVKHMFLVEKVYPYIVKLWDVDLNKPLYNGVGDLVMSGALVLPGPNITLENY